MLLYRCMGDNISDAEIIGLWNGDRCYIGIWGDIPNVFFHLRNNECCYTDVYGAIYQMRFFVCGMTNVIIQAYGDTIYQMQRLLVCGTTNVVIQVYGGSISDAGLLVCGTTNAVITGSLYLFCHINF